MESNCPHGVISLAVSGGEPCLSVPKSARQITTGAAVSMENDLVCVSKGGNSLLGIVGIPCTHLHWFSGDGVLVSQHDLGASLRALQQEQPALSDLAESPQSEQHLDAGGDANNPMARMSRTSVIPKV